MSDNLPGLSGEMGAGRPLTRAEFARRERERRALQLWIEGKSYAQIKNALSLRNTDAARELVRKGEERWEAEEAAAIPRFRAAMMADMLELRALMMEATRGGNLGAADRWMKAWERLAKLLDLDAGKDVLDGPQVVVIEARRPWERDDTIDGEAEDVPPGLPEGS